MKTLLNYTKYILSVLTVLSVAAYSLPPPDKYEVPLASSSQQILHIDQYIDANNVLMFVSNIGAFSYDRTAVFGKNDGFYYPYLGISNIQNGTATNTLCFAAGLWFAGVNSANGDTIISVSRYGSDFWPGPMLGGTFIPDADTDSLYRVYKIYSDSMSSNPNQDYLDWPSSQGAPVDSMGNPQLTGRQTLWSVYNDANSAVHINSASTAVGLGIEVQHTVWADTADGIYVLPSPTHFVVSQIGISDANVTVEIIDETLLTGHDYEVSTENNSTLGPVWHLIDVTINDTVLANQTNFGKLHTTVSDGFLVQVSGFATPFESFEVVANSSGPLDPPAGGALDFQGFPSIRPDNTQQVGAGLWAFHTGDNGGTCNGGTRGSYAAFLSSVLRFVNAQDLGLYDYEMRFTGDTNSSGVYDSSLGGGSIAIRAFQDEIPTWVPFELWNIGIGTPKDASDDVRMVVWHLDFGDDYTYNLESWGCSADLIFGGLGEHSASGGDNDPFTDWIYWLYPIDSTPGDVGYQTRAAEILAGTYDFFDEEVIARTVLINWNGGVSPPFNQSLPEPGTIFRLRTPKLITPDTFTFTAAIPPIVTAGAEDLSVYSKYKLINKSSSTYNNFFISLWFDPDLGGAGDDLVGCDTLNDIFFCYNDIFIDSDYGIRVPAFGGKLIEGPIVPSAGDTAYVNGQPVPDYKNLGMYSFMRFIGFEDPSSPRWTYEYMNGIFAAGQFKPFVGFMLPGDPVTGTGELDNHSSDRRMMASFGPFDFAPNDTQQIIVKIGVGQGDDRLSSVTNLKEVLNFKISFEDTCCIGIRGDINGDGDDNGVLDMTYLIDYIFRGGPAPLCPIEADLNFDGRSATILDLTFIVDDIFRGGPSPGGC